MKRIGTYLSSVPVPHIYVPTSLKSESNMLNQYRKPFSKKKNCSSSTNSVDGEETNTCNCIFFVGIKPLRPTQPITGLLGCRTGGGGSIPGETDIALEKPAWQGKLVAIGGHQLPLSWALPLARRTTFTRSELHRAPVDGE